MAMTPKPETSLKTPALGAGIPLPGLQRPEQSNSLLGAKPAIAGFGIEGTNWESEMPLNPKPQKGPLTRGLGVRA